MNRTQCQNKVPSTEIYTDYYYCQTCDRNFGNVTDYCAGCEHPEVVSLLFPRIEELEKRVKELETNQSRLMHELTISNISDGELNTDLKAVIEVFDKRVTELEDWQKIILSILRDNGFLKFKPFPDFPT